MRELKFRAFYDGKMYEVQSLEWMEYDDCPASAYLFGVKGWVIVDDGKMPKDSKGIAKLLQWTGLCDRNGTEIYEGDIVKGQHPVDFEKRPFIGRVFYWDGAWYHGFHNDRPPKRMWEYVEVIGNIYENPELLEGE